MTHTSLAALSEYRRAEAAKKYALIRPHLEDGVPLTEAIRGHGITLRTARYWVRRPVIAPRWRAPTVVAVAEGVYRERAFDRLPVLADALKDAGCDDPDILTHCRGGGLHTRGCWVMDQVLGK